ncbi:MAG: TIGR04283 family arsenosugar biosynthesis glycosyltransferase [Pseudomonadota bacterium]
MKCSVIIPTLNEAQDLIQTLLPLQVFRAAGHEIILVDGMSQDDTVKIATPWVDYVEITDPNRAHQLNVGAKLAQGDVFLFLHADAIIHENSIKQIEKVLNKSAWGWFDVELDNNRFIFRCIEKAINMRSRLCGGVTGDQGIFVRRCWFERLGGFRSLPLMEDLDFTHRLSHWVKGKAVRSPLLISSRRWEKFGTIKTIFTMWWLRLAFYTRIPPKYWFGWNKYPNVMDKEREIDCQ